jgi:hypothetical protein
VSEHDDILSVLLQVRKQHNLTVTDEIVQECYEIQRKHQFDTDRHTVNQMRDIVEDALDKEMRD